MASFKNLYIFTGKGGVGKTTLALSFCEYLKSKNQNYLYVYFHSQMSEKKIHHTTNLENLIQQNHINSLPLNLVECAEKYIAKKLKSKTIAQWIIKTPFFSSLISMIPGFSYVIYLGQILEFLIDDPKRVVVLDSPSSGHALTMLESTKNFNEIFQDGTIYQDTKIMLDTMRSKGFTKINIITIPTQLAINEAIELKEKIRELENYDTEIHCNNALSSLNLTYELPEALKKKISNEKLALSNSISSIQSNIKYSTKTEPIEVIKDLVPYLESLV